MSKENSPDADDQLPEKRSSQQLLSLLLLLLIILFGYLYFFTGVIKPREEQPKPQPVAEAPVKTPIPPRPAAGEKGGEAKVAQGEAGKGGAAQAPGKPGAPAQEAAAKPAAGAKEGAAKDHAAKETPAVKEAPAAKGAPAAKEAAKTAPSAKEAAKPAPGAKEAAKTPGAKEAVAGKPTAPGAKPAAPASQAKPATAQAKPGEKPAQAKAGQPAGAPAKEAKAAVTGKPGAEKAGAAKKGAERSAEKPGAKGAAVAKAGEKPETAAKAAAKPKSAAKPKAVAKGAYTLELSGDLAENEIPSVLAKLKKAGITQVVKTKSQKGEEMHRLYLADFASRDEAVEELERLKLAAPSAFMLRENGRYAVYAGSYLRDAKASMEQNRLQGKGVQTVMKSANAPVSVMRLRAGSFADQAGAEKAAKTLKKAGLSTKVVRLAKAEK